MLTLGIVSDTHGLVRPELLAALQGVDHILHAGDIGKPAVMEALEAIAPVTAIRGNVDKQPWTKAYPETALYEAEGASIYLVHSVDWLDLDPGAAGIDAVISGHSHRPGITWKEGVLYLNPGSPGPRRFKLPVSCARLRVDDGRLEPELVMLTP